MDLREKLGNRSRLARTALAVALTAAALGSLRKGKRLTGVLAGAGAAALGYTAATGTPEQTAESETDTAGATDEAGEGGELRCGICNEPILPGQKRGPDEDGEIVHEACEESG